MLKNGTPASPAMALAAEGLNTDTLALLAQKQRAAAEALEQQAATFLAQHAHLVPGLTAEISMPEFSAQPQAAQLLVLDYTLKLTGGHWAPIRHGSLVALCAALTMPGCRPKTLARCRIALKKIGQKAFIRMIPERAG